MVQHTPLEVYGKIIFPRRETEFRLRQIVVHERKSSWCNFIAWQRHRRNKRLAPRAVDCDVWYSYIMHLALRLGFEFRHFSLCFITRSRYFHCDMSVLNARGNAYAYVPNMRVSRSPKIHIKEWKKEKEKKRDREKERQRMARVP